MYLNLVLKLEKSKEDKDLLHKLLKLILKLKQSIKLQKKMKICVKRQLNSGDRKNDKRYLIEIMFWRLISQRKEITQKLYQFI
ncbi:unnamed protein product [Paramecium primaurelia]|uniref:Uncharacterized protein n=1 Tax=Paramecium primaurelia TaxID=5886 RepID=A0A8S1JMH9_PARPR|nr:unnamed protein product [Paramecium primaurelia]